MVIFAEPARMFESMEKAINHRAHTNKPCSRGTDEIAEAMLKKLLASGVDMPVTGKPH